jgi:hypothetical protein
METKKRVYWSDSEKEKILDHAADYIRKNPIAAISDVLEKAQSGFAKDRRRPVGNLAADWVNIGLKKRLAKNTDLVDKLEDNILKLESELEIVKEQLAENPTKDDLIEEALDTMDSTEMLARFIRKHGDEHNALLYELERMNEFVFVNLAATLKATNKATLIPPTRKKLVFVGFKQHIADSIDLDFSKYAELSFVASSMPLNNYPNKCDQIFISLRDTSDKLRKKFYDSKYRKICNTVNGGVVKLRKAIWSHLNGRETP